MLAFLCELTLFVLTHIPFPPLPVCSLSLILWFHSTSHYYHPPHCLLSWPFHPVQFVLTSFPSTDLLFPSQRPESKRGGKNFNLLVLGHLFNLNYSLSIKTTTPTFNLQEMKALLSLPYETPTETYFQVDPEICSSLQN